MKPILFNTEMVKAILAGRKTVTRRLIKSQPPSDNAYLRYIKDGFARFGWEHSTALCDRKLPYQIGDVLYVRETWTKQQGIYWHRAGLLLDENGRDFHGTVAPAKWKPSIHMPKEAARIFLRVTDVRVERLQDITEEEANSEGCFSYSQFWDGQKSGCFSTTGRMAFADVWDCKIKIKKSDLDKYGWDANPWLWVMGFERISKEEALKNDKQRKVYGSYEPNF